jgi:hypothetical protein
MYMMEHQHNWDTYIPYVLAAYQCLVNEATLKTPFDLTYGRDHYLPIDVSLGLLRARSEEDTGDYQSGLMEQLMRAFRAAKEHQLEAQERNCRSYNRDRTDKPFGLGEKVWLHVPSVRKERSKKFTRPWRGPYRVVEIRGGLNYGLVNTHNPRDHQFAHVSRLKKWIGPVADDGGSSDVLGTATRSASGGGGDEHVEVDEILNDRTTARGLEYLVRYKGHTERHNQWVPVNDVNAPGLISHFERGRRFAEASEASKARQRKAGRPKTGGRV